MRSPYLQLHVYNQHAKASQKGSELVFDWLEFSRSVVNR